MSDVPYLAIASNAATSILSAPRQILIHEALLPVVAPLELNLTITAFDDAGHLYDPAIGRSEGGDVVRIAAVPHEVVAIAAYADRGGVARALRAAFEAAKVEPLPICILPEAVGSDAETTRSEFLSRFLPAIVSRLADVASVLSRREAEAIELRRLVEWQALALRRGRETVEAIGYDTRTIACELDPGDEVLRPADHSPSAIVQRLPVKLSGISAVALHLAETVEGSGRMIVGIGRPDLLAAQARIDVAYARLSKGWNEFRFPEAVGASHGDAVLTVAFIGDPGRPIPAFSLTNAKVEGFGLLAPVREGSLALRVWKGLSAETFGGALPLSPIVRTTRILASRLRTSVSYFEGAAVEAVLRRKTRSGPLAHVDETGALQLHALSDRASGALLHQFLPAGTKTVRFSLRLPDAASANGPVLVGAMVSSEPADRTGNDLRASVEAVLADAANSPLTGRNAVVKRVDDGTPAAIELTLAPSLAPSDLVVFAEPVEADFAVVAEHFEFDTELERSPGRRSPFAHRFSFPELKSRISYVFGAGEAARVSQMLGFAVLDVSDVENFMQTHPVMDELSGARITSVLPSGLIRVGARVGTMHPQGPVAEYLVLVVRSGAGSDRRQEFADELLSFATQASDRKPDFVIAASRRVVDPGRRADITLDLDEPLQESADLLCLVRSLSGHVGFAWCRWFDLDVEVISPDVPVIEAAPAPKRRKLFRWR